MAHWKFGFELVGGSERDPAIAPNVVLCVDECAATIDPRTDLPYLSPQLATEGEIDYYIDQHKRELEKAGERAKLALKRARKGQQGGSGH